MVFVAVVLVPEGREARDDDRDGQQFDPGRDDDGLACLLSLAYEMEGSEEADHRPLGRR